jgi:hypothetical protein
MGVQRGFSIVVVVAVCVLGGFGAPIPVSLLIAQEASLGMSSEDPHVQIDVEGRRLLVTHMRVTTENRTVACAGSGCLAEVTAFEPPIGVLICKSQTCTMKLTFCGQYFNAGVGDNLLVRYLIDGIPPFPGPTDANGFVSVERNAQAQIRAYCFNVVGGGLAKGAHTVEVRFGVQDQTGNGANVTLGFAELDIQVYWP